MQLEKENLDELLDRITQINTKMLEQNLTRNQRKWFQREKELWISIVSEIEETGYSLLN
tara:strand:+ start:8300 stop:8476 length:177 start_codon:yes stop_codon:yes gene_type:complete